ncbi:MAG: efflux RND transporter periplasmic adaptor subunit [Saprospiraceae bacterium]|nr:efflux RND transporter periplasmic adaptor subunit [Saprospiraceae bacterium]
MRFRFNFIYLVFLVGIIFFIPITKKLVSHPEEFYGIAENQIRSINLQYPVEIKEINVALGQKVDSGQLLARLYRTDTRPSSSTTSTYEIRELQVKRLIDTEQPQSELRKLEAERAAVSRNLTTKLRNWKPNTPHKPSCSPTSSPLIFRQARTTKQPPPISSSSNR